jgi:hypothetical protein
MCKKFLNAAAIAFAAFLLTTGFPARSFASSVVADSPEREATADRFLEEKLRVWQDRMNLKQWDLRVHLARADQLEPKTLGNIHWDTDAKVATICVLDPADYNLPDKDMLADMEVTVVHELVHLELASLPRTDASRRTEEHAVNEIAAALLKLARR